MAHMRAQIRDAVATALGAATSATVKKSRAYSFNSTSDFMLVYTTSERIIERAGNLLIRELRVTVEIHASGKVDALDDTLDNYAVEVETTLENNKLSGLVKDMSLDSTDGDFDASGETVKGVALLQFNAVYGTSRSDPETQA